MSLHPHRRFITYPRRRQFITGLWSMDRHIGTAIIDTVTANPAMLARRGRLAFVQAFVQAL